MFINTLVTNPVYFFRFVVIIIFSIVLHELAHGWAAMSQGDDTPEKTGHLTLNPVIHMGWESIIFLCLAGICWGQMPVNPSKFRSPKWGNILVSAAGPFSNLVLGILFSMLLKVYSNPIHSGFLSVNFLDMAAHINLTLFLFNLLPIPPLDGFHIYSEIFPELKQLENTQFGLFALMLIFIDPGFGAALGLIADLIIEVIVGR
ncbi:MAG: site-2 protease family protein [Heteroscytonema crispum UTEX LB 1556]